MKNFSPKTKLLIAAALTLLYLIIILIIMTPWIMDLTLLIGPLLALLVIGGIAVVPGILNAFLIFSICMDNKEDIRENIPREEDISIIIPCYNEQNTIYDTIKSISEQEYKGKIYLYVVDNNSTDKTKKIIDAAISNYSRDDLLIEYILEKNQGKYNALNTALTKITTKYFITIDADTVLWDSAIQNIVSKMQKEENCGAVAGAVKVGNEENNFLTRMQKWDYLLSIASVKKMQSMFKSTLVAQGAFSIYDTNLVKEIGGWKNRVGEDIVLTWNILAKGYYTYYEPKAICFTEVPNKIKDFIRQRMRWARGMIEAFRDFKPWNFKNKYAIPLTLIDVLIIYMDFSYLFFLIPGMVAALFGYPIIVGLFSLLIIPFNLISFQILYAHEQKITYRPLGLKVKRNILSFFFFILFYQFIVSPSAFIGYVKEWLRRKKSW